MVEAGVHAPPFRTPHAGSGGWPQPDDSSGPRPWARLDAERGLLEATRSCSCLPGLVAAAVRAVDGGRDLRPEDEAAVAVVERVVLGRSEFAAARLSRRASDMGRTRLPAPPDAALASAE
jgi:hypothetical protein